MAMRVINVQMNAHDSSGWFATWYHIEIYANSTSVCKLSLQNDISPLYFNKEKFKWLEIKNRLRKQIKNCRKRLSFD